MRKPTGYQKYLYDTERYYKEKNIQQPKWIHKAKMCYGFIDGWWRFLNSITRNCCISKETIIALSELEMISDIEDIPFDLREIYETVFHLVKEMYHSLMENKEQNFVCEWTLSKSGRNLVRQYTDKISSAYKKIDIPQNKE